MSLLSKTFKRPKKRNDEPKLRDQLAVRFPEADGTRLDVIESVTPFTMTSPERIFALCDAVEHVMQNDIAGDIVECGVWKGGSMAAVAQTLQASNDTRKTLWMYDTFEGMSKPSDNDVDLHGRNADKMLAEADPASSESRDSIWCRCGLESVKQTLLDTGYPESNLRFIKGKVEDTLAKDSPDQISILRLDTDWYESTRCELEVLFPKLTVGGILIIDDYGHWQGCRKAVDEYFENKNVNMFLHRVDYTGRLGIKLN